MIIMRPQMVVETHRLLFPLFTCRVYTNRTSMGLETNVGTSLGSSVTAAHNIIWVSRHLLHSRDKALSTKQATSFGTRSCVRKDLMPGPPDVEICEQVHWRYLCTVDRDTPVFE